MKAPLSITLGVRNLWLHRKRQLFLFFALLLCFSLISLLTAVSAGMSDNVYQATRIHYGGDLFALGVYGQHQERPAWVQDTESLESNLPAIEGQWVKRSQLFKMAYLYFEGSPQLMKNVIGLDYNSEKNYLSHFEVLQGDLDCLAERGSVVLSYKLAAKMGLSLGDSIHLKTTNPYGQIDTALFKVGALLEDSSFLGYYRIFMDRRDLNTLLGWDEKQYSTLGCYLQDTTERQNLSPILRDSLKDHLAIGGQISNRDDYYREFWSHWQGIRHFVFPLDVYISEVDSLIQALDLVSYLIYILMLGITFVSVLVTYRIILHDRSRELAMFRAMGMTVKEIEGMLLWEAVILLMGSLLSGFLFSLFLQGLLGFASFDWIPGFGVFLKQGRLTGNLLLSRILINSSVILLGVLPAVWLQVRRELKIPLANTLTGGR